MRCSRRDPGEASLDLDFEITATLFKKINVGASIENSKRLLYITGCIWTVLTTLYPSKVEKLSACLSFLTIFWVYCTLYVKYRWVLVPGVGKKMWRKVSFSLCTLRKRSQNVEEKLNISWLKLTFWDHIKQRTWLPQHNASCRWIGVTVLQNQL